MNEHGQLCRNGLSGGQAEAARAARLIMEASGVVKTEVAVAGEVHDGKGGSGMRAASEHGWVV